MKTSGVQNDPARRQIDPFVLGTFCGALSAVAYTASNVFLRKVALDVDPFWVSCLRALPVSIVGWLLLSLHACRRDAAVLPRGRLLGYLLLTAIFVQLGGNVAFQWSLRIVGLAIAIPLLFGTLIIAGAVLGRVFLHEPVTPRSALAMFIVIAAIGLLTAGAGEASRAVNVERPVSPSQGVIALAVGAACLSGLAYALAAVVIRRAAKGKLPLVSTLVVIATTGVVINGTASVIRLGSSGLLATTPVELRDMLLAGSFNAVAFFSLGKALQLLRVVHVNTLNASQTMLAAVAGVVLFREALSEALLLGVGLTIFGLVLMQGSERRVESQRRTESP